MISEAILSYLHLSAILAMVVFITSEGAICRPEWFNAAVLKRMLHVDLIYMICGAAVAITGVTRIILGAKGADWYIAQPMLHAKVLLFLIVGIYSVRVSIALQKWQGRFEDENGALVLVDYKTDKDTNPMNICRKYRLQIDLYTEAIEAILGRKVTERCLYLLHDGKVVQV